MFETKTYEGDRTKQYDMLSKQLDALLMGEENQVANLSNASALLNQFLDRINWVGFYLTDTEQNQLVLGPFQGLPACVRIPFGKTNSSSDRSKDFQHAFVFHSVVVFAERQQPNKRRNASKTFISSQVISRVTRLRIQKSSSHSSKTVKRSAYLISTAQNSIVSMKSIKLD